jgi:hypothetical protein
LARDANTKQRESAASAGIGARAGLSWSWHLDLDTLLAALAEPAPWNHLPKRAVRQPEPDAAQATPVGTDLADATPAGPTPAGPTPAGTSPAGATPTGSLPPGAGLPGAEPDAGAVDPVEEDFAAFLDALDAGHTSVFPLSVAAGRVAEVLPTGPDLAAWLARCPAEELEDGALPGVAAAWRRIGAWAQASELAVVAQMASRSAARETENGTGKDGRPTKITPDACGQVSLALTMSQAAAQSWTDLAVTLRWRLPGTGAALNEGTIDLPRARAIAEATAPLDDDKAKAVEDKVLPRAAEQTTGQLRAALRRAVITADPEGAERRREEAEQRAKVTLYPDPDGTAALTAQNLPGIRAAAAMARITALARGLKASGATGGIDLLRSKVFLGLLLGTLPHIPPPPGRPPDPQPPADPHPPEDYPGPHLDDWPWNNDPAPATSKTTEPDQGKVHPPSSGKAHQPKPGKGSAPSDEGTSGTETQPNHDRAEMSPGAGAACAATEDSATEDSATEDSATEDSATEDSATEDSATEDSATEDSQNDDSQNDEDLPPGGRSPLARRGSWPEATPFAPPGPAALRNLVPAGSGFLDLRLPLATLSGGGPEPGYLTRLGPITPAQASYLAHLAARDPAVDWRLVLTDNAGRAIAVTRIRRRRSPARPARAGPDSDPPSTDPPSTDPPSTDPPGSETPSSETPGSESRLVRRVTVIIATAELASAPVSDPRMCGQLASLVTVIISAARLAACRAAERTAADAAAGGCAHTEVSPAYQVPTRLREYVSLRDLTCRFPTCRQPAWRCDCDHSKPYDKGGPTCCCNLGALCRYHHKLKQHPLWGFDQPTPGNFTWTTSVGRTYTIQPDTQAA